MTDYKENRLEISVSQEWRDQFENLARQTGRSQTELVQEALAQYFEGAQAQQAAVLVKIEQFESKLNILKQKVAELEPYKQQAEKFQVRLKAIERKLFQSENQGPPPSEFENELSHNCVEEAEDDDIDDEPDEVLIDFLPR